MKVYLQIFARTFAALAAASILAAQAWSWTSATYHANGAALAVSLLVAVIGGLVAAGTAFVRSPATTPMQKAVRNAVQAVVGILGTLVINSFADVVSAEKLIVPAIAAVVFAFALGFLQNQASAAGLPPRG